MCDDYHLIDKIFDVRIEDTLKSQWERGLKNYEFSYRKNSAKFIVIGVQIPCSDEYNAMLTFGWDYIIMESKNTSNSIKTRLHLDPFEYEDFNAYLCSINQLRKLTPVEILLYN